MIPLHPILDHTPSVTSLTSILPAMQPLLVCFPWPRNTSALHSLCLPPYCFFLFIVKLHKMSLFFLSFITWFIWLLGFLCCRPLSFPVIPLLPSLPCLCSSCILYWVEQSHHQPSQLPKMKPSSHLDFLPIYLQWPISHQWILPIKHWSGSSLSIPMATKPLQAATLPPRASVHLGPSPLTIPLLLSFVPLLVRFFPFFD